MVARTPAGEIQIREYQALGRERRRAPTRPGGSSSGRRTTRTSNHNGGQVEFGPDGYLWFATGDGGGGQRRPQPRARPLEPARQGAADRPAAGQRGELRDPASNPFGTAVWAYGLRNPFRFSFDRGTGDLWIGDVGQGAREEIDRAPAAGGLGAAATTAGPAARARSPGRRRCTVSAPLHPAGVRLRQRGRHARGHRRRTSCATRACRRCTAATCTRDIYDGQRALARTRRAGADGRRGRPGLAVRNTLVSFGEDACGHIYVASLDRGSVDRDPGRRAGRRACSSRRRRRCPRAARTGGGGPAGPDRTAPRVRIRVARKGRVGRRARPQIALTASEACRVTIRARLGGWTLVARPHSAPRRPPHGRPPPPEGEGGQAHPPLAPPPQAPHAARVGDLGGRGRQHRPRRAAAEGQARLGVLSSSSESEESSSSSPTIAGSGGASGSLGPPGIGSPLYSSGSSTSSPSIVTEPSSWWRSDGRAELRRWRRRRSSRRRRARRRSGTSPCRPASPRGPWAGRPPRARTSPAWPLRPLPLPRARTRRRRRRSPSSGSAAFSCFCSDMPRGIPPARKEKRRPGRSRRLRESFALTASPSRTWAQRNVTPRTPCRQQRVRTRRRAARASRASRARACTAARP